MPRKLIEWSKCIIYKIWKDDDFYVGSTTDLASRKRNHKSNCKISNLKIYQTIREKGGWIAWQMTPLEEYKECKSQIEARIREEEWRVKIQANLNSQKCFGAETRQEYDKIWREEHKEQIAEKKKEYAQINKEELAEYQKEYRDEHKEQLIEYQKEWYEKNKEQIAEKGKIYRKLNKEKIAEKAKKRYKDLHQHI